MAVTTGIWSARRLLLTMSSQSASTFANQVVAFVIPWLVLSRTGSTPNAGGVAFATAIASVAGTLFGGVVVDRIGGRRTATVSDALSLVSVLALVVALVADFVPLWLIVVTQVLGVLFDGPGMVAGDALVPRVAREDDVPLVRATSLQQTLQNTAQFVGPLAAGLLIAAVAEQGTLLVAAAMFAAAMALIAGLERQRITHDRPGRPGPRGRPWRPGLRRLSFAVGLVGAGACRSSTPPTIRTPEELLGRVSATSEMAVAVAVAANAVMVAAFALVPAMRLIDQEAGQHLGQAPEP